MKRILVIVLSFIILESCSNNGGESGTVNDGYNGISDPNGGLPDTGEARLKNDSSRLRVDTEKRDSLH